MRKAIKVNSQVFGLSNSWRRHGEGQAWGWGMVNIETSVRNMLDLRWPLDVKVELSDRQMCAS